VSAASAAACCAATTLWLLTVIGLCLGGGQIGLGLAASGRGRFALWVLRWVEARLPQHRHSRLAIDLDAIGCRKLTFDIHELHRPTDRATPAFVAELAPARGVMKIRWQAPL
jgi:putative Mg2+ transporter-C (MgtC) family protein